MLPAAGALVWNASPRHAFCNLVFRLIGALVPVASLWVAKQIIDRVAASGSHAGFVDKTLWMLVGVEFLLAALASLAGRGVDYCDGRIAEEFSREVSQRVIRHSVQMDLAHFEDASFQDLMERARVQATDRALMLSDMGRLFQQTVTLISLSTATVMMSPWLLVVVVVSMIPAFLAESHYTFASYSLSHEVTPLRRELDYLRQLCTSASSIKEVKLFQLGGFLEGRFCEITGDLIHRSRSLARRRIAAGSIFGVVGSLGYFGAYAYLVTAAMRGEFSVGTLTFLAGTLAASSSNFQGVFGLLSKIADEVLFLNDLFLFLKVTPAQSPARQLDHVAVAGVRGSTRKGVEFRNVSFSYPGTERVVLRNVCFRIDPRERIALVGANGQGKTTIVKLLSRLYDPTSGAIYLDGADLRDYSIDELWKRIGIVFQDFVKYEMTAGANIAVGRIEELGNEGLLRESAQASGADETLAKLPKGLDQLLGRRFEGGVDLSGGEWQKIALARAYLRRADILVLDEPTAALDAHAEHEVFERFSDLAEDRMTLLISHRFSTVRIADRILVLDDGVIREQGTHKDLLARRGRYAHMFELQAANYR